MLVWFLASTVFAQDFHMVRVVDSLGQPHPCADLETINHIHYTTDQDGYAAIYEPGLMDEDVWLTPTSVGIDTPTDWLGLDGLLVTLTSGGFTEVELLRAGPDPVCNRGDVAQRQYVEGVPSQWDYHEIQVIDRATGNPVPNIRVEAYGEGHWTDSGGRVAWYDLDHMDEEVTFQISGHGYQHATGVELLQTTPFTVSMVEVDRVNIAERLVRLTGGGTWRDSALLGYALSIEEPYLDSKVLGQDTAQVVAWRGMLFQLWGDTNKPSYPLGVFNATGATLPFDRPEDGVNYNYATGNDGFARGIAPTYAEGAVWLGGLVALDDNELWATFLNISPAWVYLREGMLRWDDAIGEFVEVVHWPADQEPRPNGHTIRYDGPDGDWVMYRDMERIPATTAALADPTTYEAWTPLQDNGLGGWEFARTNDNLMDWQWRTGTPNIAMESVDDGWIDEDDSPWHNTWEPETAERPLIHNGAIMWSRARQRWIHVFTQNVGTTSWIGEIWYAEGDTPVGPWSYGRKIITHDDYSFYNPAFHPWWTDRAGLRVYFEGTYTSWLGAQGPTPRHDYNQVLYALDLDAPDLNTPVNVYNPTQPRTRLHQTQDASVAFAALDRQANNTHPVYWTGPECDPNRRLSLSGDGEIAFWALPAGTVGNLPLADLVTWTHLDGHLEWSIDDLSDQGAVAGDVLGTVWPPMWDPLVPLSLYPPPDFADAGSDQCDVISSVSLSASGSHLTEGVDSYLWSWAGGASSSADIQVDLAPGTHVFALTASGADGDVHDTVVVHVAGELCDPTDIEMADGVDNNCNGIVDEGTVWFDDDGDGYAEVGGDCADADPNIHPGVVETCDSIDQDCDGTVDEGTSCYDDDGDGVTEDGGDCNDNNPAINPGEAEDPLNGLDDDCDGVVDVGTNDPDGDGVSVAGGDCVEGDSTIYPGAPELLDGLDNDCDGEIDEGTDAYDDDGDGYSEADGDCNDDDPAIHPGAAEVRNGIDDDCDGDLYQHGSFVFDGDDDGDGYTVDAGDCDDDDFDVHPGAVELENGVDDDCDGSIDEDFLDIDGDGFTVDGGDCDDADGWANPDAEEVCDEVDNNCDGIVDEDCNPIDKKDRKEDASTGCSCATTSSGTLWMWPGLLTLLAGFQRRRRP